MSDLEGKDHGIQIKLPNYIYIIEITCVNPIIKQIFFYICNLY